MAAGSGTRMGGDIPKQFMEIDGKAVLQRTMEIFVEACPDVTVVTVLPKAHISYWKDYCIRNNFICPQIIVPGGITRFHSVRNALEKVPEGAIVAIHDGVRPLISVGLVREMMDMAQEHQAIVPVVPCVDTMKVLCENEGVLSAIPGQSVDRSHLFGAQTPQIFHSELLKAAYSQAFDTSFTDDASVVEKYGKSLSYIHGEKLNIKITTADDLVLAKAVLAMRNY